MSAPYVNHAELVRDLAPTSMPCFADRLTWVTYLESAAIAQRQKHAPGPLLFEPGQPVRFNRDFDVCSDCTAQHSFQMFNEGRCVPDWLRLLPSLQPTTTISEDA